MVSVVGDRVAKTMVILLVVVVVVVKKVSFGVALVEVIIARAVSTHVFKVEGV